MPVYHPMSSQACLNKRTRLERIGPTALIAQTILRIFGVFDHNKSNAVSSRHGTLYAIIVVVCHYTHVISDLGIVALTCSYIIIRRPNFMQEHEALTRNVKRSSHVFVSSDVSICYVFAA
eukprot:scaffold762_cov363-Pavlova_lutheri.AAC.47